MTTSLGLGVISIFAAATSSSGVTDDPGVQGELNQPAMTAEAIFSTLEIVEVNEKDARRMFLGLPEAYPDEGHHDAEVLFRRGRKAFLVQQATPRFDVGLQNLSPVKYQGMRGTCSFFAAVALLEFGTHERYSEQCLAYFSRSADASLVADNLRCSEKPDGQYKHLFKGRPSGLVFQEYCPYKSYEGTRAEIPREIFTGAFPSVTRPFRSKEFPISSRGRQDDPVAMVKRLFHQYQRPIAGGVYVVDTKEDRFWEQSNKLPPDGESKHPSHLNWSRTFFNPIPALPPNIAFASCSKSTETTSLLAASKKLCGRHAIVFVGYNDELGILRFRNSWGTGWGHAGYGWLSYEYFRKFYISGSSLVLLENK